MRAERIRSWWAVAFAAVLLPHTAEFVRAADEPGKPVKPSAEWGGNAFVEEDDKVLAPGDLHIVDEKEWAKLWSAWTRQTRKTPQVNFKENLVLVVATREEISDLAIRVDDKGNLTVTPLKVGPNPVTRKSGEGWYYRLSVLPREGIKTIAGRPVKTGDLSHTRAADDRLEDITERLKKLEQANAELRATVERLQKEIEQLKKK